MRSGCLKALFYVNLWTTFCKSFINLIENQYIIFITPTISKMRFVSKKCVFDGDKVKSVEGDLTLLGQTKPVVLEAAKFNCYHNKMANKQACGGDFKTQIKPTDWGFKMPQDAEIKIQVEAFKD